MRVSIYRIAGMLVLAMLLVLAACGGGTAEETADTEAEPTTAVEATDEPEADEPEADEPEADEPEADEPTDEPEADEPEEEELTGEEERNDQGGYSFLVPEGWQLLTNESMPEFGTITTLAPEDADPDDPGALIMMVAGDVAAIYSGAETDIDVTEASLDELMEISSENNEQMGLTDFEEIEVDGMDARMAIVQGEDADMGDVGGSMVIVMLENARVMQMIGLAQADEWDQELFDAFIDNVEFFEPVEEEDTETSEDADGQETMPGMAPDESDSGDGGEGDAMTGPDNPALGLPATDQGSVEIGGEASATLDTIFEAHDWTFEGESGQVVTISVAAAPGSEVDPRINLLGPDNEWLIADDDGGSGTDALIEDYALPASGAYTIKVDVFESGEYVVSVSEGGEGASDGGLTMPDTEGGEGASDGGLTMPDTENDAADSGDGNSLEGSDNSALGLPSVDQGSVEIGGEASATLDTIFEAHDWTFEGESGQVVTISAAAAAGSSVDPRLNLLGPDGEWLTANDDGGSGTDALIEGYTLPASGTYTIKIDVFEGGEYILSVE